MHTRMRLRVTSFLHVRGCACVGGGKKGIKKAKKLKRHISLNVHQDKLPVGCASDEMKEMMTAIMDHLEEVEACIETPHKCDPRDL